MKKTSCPQCGTPIPGDAKQCPSCGFDLESYERTNRVAKPVPGFVLLLVPVFLALLAAAFFLAPFGSLPLPLRARLRNLERFRGELAERFAPRQEENTYADSIELRSAAPLEVEEAGWVLSGDLLLAYAKVRNSGSEGLYDPEVTAAAAAGGEELGSCAMNTFYLAPGEETMVWGNFPIHHRVPQRVVFEAAEGLETDGRGIPYETLEILEIRAEDYWLTVEIRNPNDYPVEFGMLCVLFTDGEGKPVDIHGSPLARDIGAGETITQRMSLPRGWDPENMNIFVSVDGAPPIVWEP